MTPIERQNILYTRILYFNFRLRELELAATPEQKQEILRLFKLESEPIIENQSEYIIKTIQGLLVDEKFSSFLNIRKGKVMITTLVLFKFLLMCVVDVNFEVIAIPNTG